VGGGLSATGPPAGAAISTSVPAAGAPFLVLTLAARSIDKVTQAWVAVRWLDARGGALAERRLGFWPGTDWEEFFFADGTPPAAARALITIGGRDPFWVDDVAFAPAPPAASAGAVELPAAAVFRPSERRFYLRSANRPEGFDRSVEFGRRGDLPLIGDWDGNGSGTIGAYSPPDRSFHLRNANAPGADDLVVALGAPGDLPVAGDWDGDGTTNVGVYHPEDNTFHLLAANVTGARETVFVCGAKKKGLQPLAGDWDGDGKTGVGTFDPAAGRFTLCDRPDLPARTADFGADSDLPLVGDWDGDGDDTIGAFRPQNGTLYIRQSNTSGYADAAFALGQPGDVPVPGSSRLTLAGIASIAPEPPTPPSTTPQLQGRPSSR
jgi:hypothetical protein